MKIENLKEGQVLKNYRELCEILEIKHYTGGKSKQLQLKDFQRFCEYHKDGNNFIIDKILENPKEKIDKRGKIGNNRKYIDNIKNIVLYELNNTKDNTIILTKNKALELVGIVNINFAIGKNNVDEVSEKLNIDKFYINNFYRNNYSELIKILERALEDMHNKGIINFKKTFQICEKICMKNCKKVKKEECDKVKKEECKVMSRKQCENYRETHRLVTDKENDLILRTEQRILSKYGFTNKKEVFIKGKYNQMIKETSIQISENNNYYYKVYVISRDCKMLFDEIDESKYINSKVNLNNDIYSKVLKNIGTSQERAIKNIKRDIQEQLSSCAFGEIYPTKNKYDELIEHEEYKKIQMDLSKFFITIDPTKNLENELNLD